MNPFYSILLCNLPLQVCDSKIANWLALGVKVLWFGRAQDVAALREKYAPFAKAFLLQAYETSLDCSGILIDGKGDPQLFSKIAADCPQFNAAQYEVEHCRAAEHVVVQASAGTGKTTVMIDRILYLLHTQPGLRLSEIFMITFTNDAAQQMSRRLQDALMTRYTLTRQKKYLRWVEEQSQMHISTIHSFAYDLLKRLGIGESFTQGLQIRDFGYEKKELVKNALDQRIDDRRSVESQLGLSFYRANAIVGDYWGKFLQLGVSHRDLLQMDWGEPDSESSVHFHEMIQGLAEELDEQYFDLQRREEAVSVDDIMRDLQELLQDGELPVTDLSMKYLFIDEFQDSDLSQIRVACLLSRHFGCRLFVVGDVKQSIYRFRGATDRAFEIFLHDMREMGLGDPKQFTLVNNYRTAAGVLRRMDDYFFTWAERGLLDYRNAVVPFNKTPGTIRVIPAERPETPSQQIVELVSSELDALIARVELSGKKPTEKNRVAVLTRSNKKLSQLAGILRGAKIPVSVRRDGSFYASEAVRDFQAMVSSFLFCDEPKYIFNYLLTPYAGKIEPMDVNIMERLGGDYENLVAYLDHFLNQTTWKQYHRQLRLRPVLAVLKDMLEGEPVVDHYIALQKARRDAEGWTEERRDADTFTRARQYQANLEKLMELLQENLGGDKVSLYDVYHFLKINIATNRTEEEARVQSKDDYTSVLCMTVHKSKGLEFDTVIIPYTNESFGGRPRTELLVDPLEKKVGWYYTGDKENPKRRKKYPFMVNSYYDSLQADDAHSGTLEGVRLLYVGMTRAIDTLICVVEQPRNPLSWAGLIEEVTVRDE
ncbi:MAG: ATP-dependent helicase [Lachnospiraceae bacterium]|nr:ATP-dependent helicase [Lachnospiraceae bacterium]